MEDRIRIREEILIRIRKLDEESLDKVYKFIEQLEKEGCVEYGK